MSAGAAEINSGKIEVTIEDNVYGSTSPLIDIGEEASITFDAIHMVDGESYYLVNDTLDIPIDVINLKEKVYGKKMLNGAVIVNRCWNGIPITGFFKEKIKEGSLFDDGVDVSEKISVKAEYEISEEQFNKGENMTMYVIALGGPFPGKTEDFEFTFDIDNMLGDSQIAEIIKEFLDIQFDLTIKTLIIAIKQIDLKVSYQLAGTHHGPDMYTLNATVAEGNGTIIKSPNEESYKDGTEVNVTAQAADGYVFDYWSGDLSGTEIEKTIIMDSNKTINAHFKELPVKVTLKSFTFNKVIVQIENQADIELQNIEWNVTLQGGLLNLLNRYDNGTLENLTEGSTVDLTALKTGFLRIGGAVATVNIDIPGEDLITTEHRVTMIGPIVLA